MTTQPKNPEWSQRPSDFWVNTVAISDNAARVVAGTFFHDYTIAGSGPNKQGRFGTYCYDESGRLIWKDEFDGMDGVFAVAVAGSGKESVAAAGGWLKQDQALLRAYDSTGKPILEYAQIKKRVSGVALSGNGHVLAAAADDVYVFGKKDGKFPEAAQKMGIAAAANGFVTSVAVAPDGRWLAACDLTGNVHLGIIADGKIEKTYQWTAPQQPVDRTPGAPTAPVPFLAVQIAKNGHAFVVGGGDLVYRFTPEGLREKKDPLKYDTWDPQAPTGKTSKNTAQQNVRWVAISGDGTFLSAVANRLGPDKNNGTGLLVALSLKDKQLVKAWQKPIARNPNSTSMNAGGTYVSVADGYPLGTPSQLHLFDGKGNAVWTYATANMNWPMVVSAHGSKIAAGGDDGNVYYLSEHAPKANQPESTVMGAA